jgi:hypothetical protein
LVAEHLGLLEPVYSVRSIRLSRRNLTIHVIIVAFVCGQAFGASRISPAFLPTPLLTK